MESILNHKLVKYLEKKALLNNRQYTYLAQTPEIGQGLGRFFNCGARKQEQT